MLKFLLGIVTALICVAALVVWISLPGNAPDPVGGEDGANAGGSLLPKRDDSGPTRGLQLRPPGGAATGGSDGGSTGNNGAAVAASDAAAAPMRRAVISELGFAIDVPEGWLQLDAAGMRRYFAEFQGVTSQSEVDALISRIMLAAIRDWPTDGGVPTVIINHQLAPRREVLANLNVMLAQKRAGLDAVEVVSEPAQGLLGPFSGASMRTRDTWGTGDEAVVTERIVWMLRVADGYMTIAAEAPADDAEGLALIERMLGSVAVARDDG